MPVVREDTADAPEKLEIVEIRPGVRLKLNAADRKAIAKHQADAAEQERQWRLVNAGVEDKPAAKPKSESKPKASSAKAKTAPSAGAAPAPSAVATTAPSASPSAPDSGSSSRDQD
jgi:hypothetical protein